MLFEVNYICHLILGELQIFLCSLTIHYVTWMKNQSQWTAHKLYLQFKSEFGSCLLGSLITFTLVIWAPKYLDSIRVLSKLEFSCISRKVKFWINHLDHESRYIHPRMPMLEIKQDLPLNSCIYLMIHLISSMFSDPERSSAHYIAKW